MIFSRECISVQIRIKVNKIILTLVKKIRKLLK